MNRRAIGMALCGLLMLGLVGWLVAREDKPAQPAEPPASPEVKEIQAFSQSITEAYVHGDPAAFARFWTESGEYVDENHPPIRGRAALEQAFGKFFANRKPVKAEIIGSSIRLLGKDTAIQEGTFTVTPQDGPATSSQFSALFTRENGKWFIALLREWGDTTEISLKDLEWLIGTWEAVGEGTVRTSYEWTENKAFIRGQFTIQPKKAGDPVRSGMQIIGYDPSTEQIRSWTFDNTGGFGTATWSWEDNRWMIESVGTLADGSTTATTNILTPEGKDVFTWRSVSQVVAGEAVPDSKPIQVKRVAK